MESYKMLRLYLLSQLLQRPRKKNHDFKAILNNYGKTKLKTAWD
jgi:hypothetical protein